MKRFFCAFLSLLLLLQTLPVEALADGNDLMLTAEELRAAIAQTGLTEDAAPYHAGMRASETMSARQVTQMLETLIEHDLKSVMNTIQDLQTRVADGTVAATAQERENLDAVRREASALMDDLSFYREELGTYSQYIVANQAVLNDPDGGYTRKDQLQYSRRVRSAQELMDALIPAVIWQYDGWQEQIDTWRVRLDIHMENPPAAENDNVFDNLIRSADESQQPAIRQTLPVESAAGGKTRMARLTGDTGVTMYVLSDDQFGVRLAHEEGEAAGSIQITARDVHAPYGQQTVDARDATAYFDIRHFTVDEDGQVDVALSVSGEGYRSVSALPEEIRKGSVLSGIPLKADNGQPYLREATFNGHDIFTQELGVYRSSQNDRTHTLQACVVTPQKQAVTAELVELNAGGEAGTVWDEQAGEAGQEEHTFRFEKEWLRLLGAGTKLAIRLRSGGQTELFPLQLNVQRATFDSPLYDSYHRLSGIPGMGEIGVTLPGNLPSILAGSRLSVDFLKEYTPQLYVDLSGSIYFAMGINSLSSRLNAMNESWKSQTQKEIDKSNQEIAKKGFLAKNYTDLYAAREGRDFKKFRMLGSFTADASAFVVLQGRYIEETGGAGMVKGQAMLGVDIGLTAQGTLAYRPFFYGSLGLSLKLAFAAALDIEGDATWPEGGTLKMTSVSFGGSFTVQMRLDISATAGIGLKNVLCVSVTGYGYLNVMLVLGKPVYATIDIGGGITLQAKVLFIKWSKTLMSINKRLFDSRDSNRMRTLMAQEEGETAESLDLYNAELEVGTRQVTVSQPMFQPRMQYAEVSGRFFGFSIARDGSNGRQTLRWADLTGLREDAWFVDEGSISALLPANLAEHFAYVYDFALEAVELEGREQLVIGLLGTQRLKDATLTGPDGEQSATQEPDPDSCYAVYLLLDWENGAWKLRTQSGSRHLSGAYGNPQLRVSVAEGADWATLDLLMTANATGEADEPRYIAYHSRLGRTAGQEAYSEVLDRVGTLNRAMQGRTPAQLLPCPGGLGSSYVTAVPEGKTESDMQLLYAGLSIYAPGIQSDVRVLDTGHITYMYMLGGDGRLFYLKQSEENPDEYRLHGIRARYTGNTIDGFTRTDYDVTLPNGDFKVHQVGDITYIYWLESVGYASQGEANKYRIAAVMYDEAHDTISDTITLAILTPPRNALAPDEETLLGSLYLDQTGHGFFLSVSETTEAYPGINTFGLRMLADMHLEGMDVKYTMVSAGEHNEVLFTVRNTGSLPLYGFDVRVESGNTTLQTLHVDMVNAGNSYNVDGLALTPPDWPNPTGVYRILGAMDDINGDQWLQQRTETDFASGTTQAADDLITTPLLMPGGIACFKASVRVPANWKGEHEIGLSIHNLYVAGNWGETLETASGARTARAESELTIYRVSNNAGEGATVTRMGDARGRAVQADDPLLARINTDVAFADLPMGVAESEDLVLDSRIFTQDGERMLELSILNRAARDPDAHHAVLRAYTEDGEETFRVALGSDVVDGRTHTLVIPIGLLKGTASPNLLIVETVVQSDRDINGLNNHVVLQLDEAPLVVAQQPADAIALEGEDVSFAVAAEGGVRPYTYRWQVRSGPDGAWKDADGETGQTLSWPQVTQKMDGRQVRCIVSDASGKTAATAAATLTVTKLPLTGDRSSAGTWAALALLSLAALALLARRRNRR